MVAPASTGSICICAPSIMLVTKPSKKLCVRANVSGLQREAVRSSFIQIIIRAEAMPNKGAVKKKRKGTDSGGACCSDNPDNFIGVCFRPREWRFQGARLAGRFCHFVATQKHG